MKKVLTAALFSSLIVISSTAVNVQAAATDLQKPLSATEAKDMHIKLDGKLARAQDDQGKVSYPVIVDGRSYLPLRALGNLIGVVVGYDSATRRIQIDTKTPKTPSFAADDGKNAPSVPKKANLVKDMYIQLNGEDTFPKDSSGNLVYPIIVDGRSYLPIRATESIFGIKVDYDSPSRTIIIKTKNYVEVSNDGYTLETETNDKRQQANELPINGGKLKGKVGEDSLGKGEEINGYDFLKITATENGIFEYTIKGDDSGELRATFYDEAENFICEKDLSSDRLIVEKIGLEKGTYFIRLESTVTSPYKIDTKFTPYKLDIEDNDEMRNAQKYTTGTNVTGLLGNYNSISQRDGTDYFCITDSEGKTSLNFTVTSTEDVRITFYDKAGSYINEYDTVQGEVKGTVEISSEQSYTAPYYFMITGWPSKIEPNVYTVVIN